MMGFAIIPSMLPAKKEYFARPTRVVPCATPSREAGAGFASPKILASEHLSLGILVPYPFGGRLLMRAEKEDKSPHCLLLELAEVGEKCIKNHRRNHGWKFAVSRSRE